MAHRNAATLPRHDCSHTRLLLRCAFLPQVIKLLGMLATRSNLAVQELLLLAAVAATVKPAPKAALEGAGGTSGRSRASSAATSQQGPAAAATAAATAAAAAAAGPVPMAVDTSMLPLAAGKELHRSSHLQLLATLAVSVRTPPHHTSHHTNPYRRLSRACTCVSAPPRGLTSTLT